LPGYTEGQAGTCLLRGEERVTDIGSAEAAPPRALRAVVGIIDGFAEWSGRIFCLLSLPLVGALTYEVIARRIFGRPTIWAFDVTYMLYGTIFMLGAAYTLYKGGHIRTDIFYQNWSLRTRGTVDSVLYVLLFFPGVAFFFWAGLQEALHAWDIKEVSDASPWRPPLYPLKAVIPLSLVLLMIQGVSELLKALYAAFTGRQL
jgi:TRAP-type mannitol/chloroaromatic compound transport system permease small subunit